MSILSICPEYSTGQVENLKIHLDFKYLTDLPHKRSD